MTCANHFELEASAYCRECGKPMCAECQRPALGSVYCAEHVPLAYTAPAPPPQSTFVPPPPPPPNVPPDPAFRNSPYTAPPGAQAPFTTGGPNPGFAFVLGLAIPGVGAIYNGQYAKGLVHAVIFGVIVSLLSSGHSSFEPLLGIFLSIWIFYMAFEAYHTARKRRMGIAVDEFSSMVNLRPSNGRFPVAAMLLIGLGIILLFDTMDILPLASLERFWPVGLIVLGCYLLYNRMYPSERTAVNHDAEVGR